MKTTKLSGAALDRIVASIEADNTEHFQALLPDYRPSIDWAQAGPIIEQERINVLICCGEWQADINEGVRYYGETPLIAAMRCYVASKLGDEVQIAEGLIHENAN